MNNKQDLLQLLRELVDKLEQDNSEGQPLPTLTTQYLSMYLKDAKSFLQKRKH